MEGPLPAGHIRPTPAAQVASASPLLIPGESRRELFGVAVLAIAAAYLLVGLGSYGLLDDNEGLYAQIAQGMARGEGLVIPQLNGVPYIEKPPLCYYLVAASFRIFGESAWAARWVSSISAMACLATMVWFGRRVSGSAAARLSVLILASGLGFLLLARSVMPDMLLTTLLNGALLTAYVAIAERSRRILRLSLALLALATLTKGLVAIALFGLVVGTFVLVRRTHGLGAVIRFLADPLACALFLLIAAPWHLLASIANPDFSWFYFVNEHWLRFLGRRQPHDYYSGSALYYLPRLLLFLFPWPTFLLLKLYRLPPGARGDADARAFLWIAWLGPTLFFSASLAKANYYLVVAMPSLALLIGMRIQAVIEQGRPRLLALPAAVLLGGLAMLGARYGPIMVGAIEAVGPLRPQAGLWALAAFAAIGVTGLVLALARRPQAALVMIALMCAPILGLLLYALGANESLVSSRPLAQRILHDYPGAGVYVFQDFERMSSLPFYLGRSIRIIDSKSSDLWFGQHRGERPDVFRSVGEFLAAESTDGSVVLVEGRRSAAFRRSALSSRMDAIGQVGRVTIFRATSEQSPLLPVGANGLRLYSEP